MKTKLRIISFVLCFLLAFSLCGCNGVLIDDTLERKAYGDKVEALFSALDSKDKDAVYELFAPSVRKIDTDLKEQIDKLMTVYVGPMSENGSDKPLAGEESLDGKDKIKSAYSTFPVRCGETYYWCYLELVYENTVDPDAVGIVRLDFYTADEFCLCLYDDQTRYEFSAGLSVFAEEKVEAEVRCINGLAYKYSEKPAVDAGAVKEFLKDSDNFAEFEKRFGEPCAENIWAYYELPDENGEKRYLKIVTEDDGTIIGAHIVDAFDYVDTLFIKE